MILLSNLTSISNILMKHIDSVKDLTSALKYQEPVSKYAITQVRSYMFLLCTSLGWLPVVRVCVQAR